MMFQFSSSSLMAPCAFQCWFSPEVFSSPSLLLTLFFPSWAYLPPIHNDSNVCTFLLSAAPDPYFQTPGFSTTCATHPTVDSLFVTLIFLKQSRVSLPLLCNTDKHSSLPHHHPVPTCSFSNILYQLMSSKATKSFPLCIKIIFHSLLFSHPHCHCLIACLQLLLKRLQ